MKTAPASTVILTHKNYLAEAQMRNHFAVIDEPLEAGGGDSAPTPMEYLLTAIGGCVSITLRMYAERKGWDLGKITVNVKLETVETENGMEKKILEEIHFEKEITSDQHKRLQNIAGKCPVVKLVKGETLIESRIV